VWSRLERPSGLSSVVVKQEEESDEEYESTSYESATSSSSESEPERIVVRSTVRLANQSDDEDVRRSSYSHSRNGRSTENVDLRSKLNKKKSSSAPQVRSPLRIEIDNDEYYRLIDAGKE